MNTELLAALDDRTATYGLLARLLGREVDLELLSGLTGLNLPEDTGAEALDEGARLMNAYLAQAGGDAQDTRTELAVDFARLFVVRERKTSDAAYPFESVYASDEHCTMGAARDEVRALYRAAGVERNDGWNVGEDHVALELEFMQILGARTAEALRAGDASHAKELLGEQARFLDRHLLRWVPRLADAMVAHAHTDFYRGLARFAVGYLQSDRTSLDDLSAALVA